MNLPNLGRMLSVMDKQEIASLVKQLDTSHFPEQHPVWEQLRPLQEHVVPYLLQAYPTTKKWQGRVALVFYSVRFARTSESAFQLGLLACKDKATLVRYRASGLLAYSLKNEAVPHLERLLDHRDAKTVEDAVAAIDAIKSQNHHYFVDRNPFGASVLASR